MRFNPVSQKIIWGKLVISNLGPVSEGFSADPHSDPTFTFVILPRINQVWISPQIRTKVQEALGETKEKFKPRIYRLSLD